MTKNTPRIFISLLLMLLCIGILPVSAFASDGDYPDDALPTAPISSSLIVPPSVQRESWSEPTLTRSRRKQRSTAPPAIPFPSGSRSRQLRSSMPLPSTIRRRRLRQRRQRIPPRPRKKPLKRLRKLANMCGSTGAALPLPPRFC